MLILLIFFSACAAKRALNVEGKSFNAEIELPPPAGASLRQHSLGEAVIYTPHETVWLCETSRLKVEFAAMKGTRRFQIPMGVDPLIIQIPPFLRETDRRGGHHKPKTLPGEYQSLAGRSRFKKLKKFK